MHARNENLEELRNQVRQAMKLLEEGKQVAAFNLLKRIIDNKVFSSATKY